MQNYVALADAVETITREVLPANRSVGRLLSSAQHKSQLVVKRNISLSLSVLCELSHQGKDYLALLSLCTDDPFLGLFGRLALAAHVSQKLCLLDLISVHKRSGSRCQGQPKLPALCPLDCVFEKEASARTAAPAVLYLAH